jgi:Kef-type K+ transport system membrane component KefB
VFFVLIGMKVEVHRFADVRVLGFAGLLFLAAVVGKTVCALGVRGRADPWIIGLGMVPRGEVGLIFASIGTTLVLHGRPVVPPVVFSATVLVVMVTTLAVPPLLTRRYGALAIADRDGMSGIPVPTTGGRQIGVRRARR